MKVDRYNQIEEIIRVNARSAKSKNGIKIIELSSLGEIIPFGEAEKIRKMCLENNIQIQQLTNRTSFGPWTQVKDFIEQCMGVRCISSETLPTKVEILLFDDTVAFYQIKPDVSVVVIENADFATQQRTIFDIIWKLGSELTLQADGSTLLQ